MGEYTLVMQRETCLITGGAGYIGSHIVDILLKSGKNVVVYDSLVNGLKSRIDFLSKKHRVDIPLVVGDIREIFSLKKVLEIYSPNSIVHTAALKSVSSSITNPVEYFEVNFYATQGLLELASERNIKKFVFSSTAAVYGDPATSEPIGEDSVKVPISPYGSSKLEAEKKVNEFLNVPGNLGTSLRFFNVVGTGASELVDNSKDNLIPILIDCFSKSKEFVIHGRDYKTSDGTCIRDYVDVRDIAQAHLKVLEFNQPLPFSINIGSGQGHSVVKILETVSKFYTEEKIKVVDGPRRLGDSATLQADISRMRTILDFYPEYSLNDSISSLFVNRIT